MEKIYYKLIHRNSFWMKDVLVCNKNNHKGHCNLAYWVNLMKSSSWSVFSDGMLELKISGKRFYRRWTSINLSNPEQRRWGCQQLSLQEPVDFTEDAAKDIQIDETGARGEPAWCTWWCTEDRLFWDLQMIHVGEADWVERLKFLFHS